MPGLALRFNVKVGDAVKKDQVLCVMEAMKMENEIYSPCDGTVASISVNQGDQLQGGDVIMTIA
ncbi:MAG: acetyl-CoA carboxylase biotin carboxyl carrier protein subunit [Spirochaetales bacterium]|nr:acetyl-CoA carboxylase biotin carboxyl carrier protein subunit [Spirochaetales bacterium]